MVSDAHILSYRHQASSMIRRLVITIPRSALRTGSVVATVTSRRSHAFANRRLNTRMLSTRPAVPESKQKLAESKQNIATIPEQHRLRYLSFFQYARVAD